MKRKRLANIENYLKSLKEIRDTAFENHAKGYLECLESIIADLETLLE